MTPEKLVTKLDELIQFETDRIRKIRIPPDHRSEEYRDNIGKLMRYMGKRDMAYYIKHLLEYE